MCFPRRPPLQKLAEGCPVGRVDAASVAVAAARCAGGAIAYDEPVDLSEYDRALGIGGR